MAGDEVHGPQIRDIPMVRVGDPAGGGPGGGGRPGRRRPAPAVLAAAAIVALSAGIVGLGIAGPRPQGASEAVDPSAPATAIARPIESGDASGLFRRSGEALADEHVLVGGRWLHLGTGRAVGRETGCERERILVLAYGRIVCIARDVDRRPGATVTRYELRVVTLGWVRLGPDDSTPRATPAEATSAPLVTLAGRRDLVIGDPVAIAPAPGPGVDELLLAWAAREDAGYRVVLDRYRIRGVHGDPADGGPEVVWTGRWELDRLPATGPGAIDTIGELLVSPGPDGSRILVGWTEAGPGVARPSRRLVVVRPALLETPASLPADVTRGGEVAAGDGPLRPGTPCGGSLGEGFATDRTIFVVCPGPTAELRRIDVSEPGRGPEAFGTVTAVTRLVPALGLSGSAWIAGNGVAIDRTRGYYYRWSPWARTLWKVDLTARDATGGQPMADRVVLRQPEGWSPARQPADGPPGQGPDAVGPGPLPIIAIDEPAGRLYLLGVPPGVAAATGATGPGIAVVGAARLLPIAQWAIAQTEARSIVLSPDRRYLYLATGARPGGTPPLAVAVAVHDAAVGAEIAYAGLLPVAADGPLEAVVVR